MHRTTVYLPDELRDRLVRASREDHRSEADLIREGVERVLRERLLRDDPPEARLPLVDSAHPGLGLALDWFFQDMPSEVLDWLVSDCRSIWAQQMSPSGSYYDLRLEFRDEGDQNRWTPELRGPLWKLERTWSNICWSLELWRGMVTDGRDHPDGLEEIISHHWQPDKPPLAGASSVEIAHVADVRHRVAPAV